MESVLFPIVSKINEYLSNYILIFLLLGVGLWYSIKTRFVQVRCFGEGMRKVFGNCNLRGGRPESGMSSFQALATAIAAQVGTGNIVGACGAILTGGPGAIFWMWVIAFFGMATIYAEATLAQKTRIVGMRTATIQGGPVYLHHHRVQGRLRQVPGRLLRRVPSFWRWASWAAWCSPTPSAPPCKRPSASPPGSWVIVLVIICAIIFLGGVQRLASVTEKLVPIMAGVFLLGGLVILICRIKYVPATFGMIFKYAFQPQAIIGGGFGYALKTAISQGAKRGLFSNEAGMGSTPHAHAQANVKHAHDQGVVAMIGVFIDTFVVLTLNALVIICTLYTKDGILATGVIPEGIGKTNLAQTAFGSVFGASLGAKFVAVCLLFFAFSTILSWNLFGKINADYLFGKKNGKLCSVIYTIIALVFIFLGTVSGSDFVWEVTDMFNNFIVLPNVIALFALTGMVVASLNEVKKDKLKV